MAAAALSRSRGVAGGLYFLFTLLCLVCLASSRIDEKLKDLREDNQKIERDLENLKAQRATISELTREHMSVNEAMIAFVEKQSPEDSLLLKGNLEGARSFMEKIKTYIDEQNELMDTKIAGIELNLGRAKTVLRALEEHQTEL